MIKSTVFHFNTLIHFNSMGTNYITEKNKLTALIMKKKMCCVISSI